MTFRLVLFFSIVRIIVGFVFIYELWMFVGFDNFFNLFYNDDCWIRFL